MATTTTIRIWLNLFFILVLKPFTVLKEAFKILLMKKHKLKMKLGVKTIVLLLQSIININTILHFLDFHKVILLYQKIHHRTMILRKFYLLQLLLLVLPMQLLATPPLRKELHQLLLWDGFQLDHLERI